MKYLIVTMVFLLICLLPYLMNLELIPSFRASKDLLQALESSDLRLIISGCIASSVPIILDILRDILTFRRRLASYIADFGNSILLLVVIIPDVILLLSVFPEKDVRSFVVIDGCRDLAIYGCFLFYIFRTGDESWKSVSAWVVFFVGLSGFAAQIWAPFISDSLQFVADCLIIAAITLFTVKACGLFWNQYQRWRANNKILKISINQYSCSVYVIMALLFLYLTVIFRFCFGSSGYFRLSLSSIIAQNIMCVSLYIVISTFERDVVIQETIIQVRTLHVQHFLYSIQT